MRRQAMVAPAPRTRAVDPIIRLQRDQYKDKVSNPQL